MAQDHSCDHHGVPFRSLSDHLAAVLAVGKPTTTRTVATEESAGLVLAEDARANLPVPPFSNSAMDGFLVRATTCRRAPARGSCRSVETFPQVKPRLMWRRGLRCAS